MVPKINIITTLKELEDFIEKGDEHKLKESIDLFHKDLENNKQGLYELYLSGSQCATQTALILAACRSNQADILYYLLYETNILDHFPGADFDDQKVRTQRTEAFKFAISCDAFPMVELLYDYWSGDLHWIGNDIKKITTLGKMLEEARVKCAVNNQQMLIDIHSLIKFNAFQQELYSSITNIAQEKPEDMLAEVFRIYDKYSDLNQVRIPHEEEETERELRTDLEDKISDYLRMQFYITYKIYFRKLDFNVALLILDNWFILRGKFRERFNQPKEYFTNNPTVKSSYEKAVSLYKDIECTLYHFIYRTWDDWTLYLPKNRHITVEEHTGIHEGRIIENLKIKYDKHALYNGPVLFLERKSFSDRVKELKSLLEAHIISANPAKIWVQNYKMKKPKDIFILLDDNYLTPITLTDINTPTNTYMRDFYSISKIVYYIKAIENTNDVLMIERVLQVTGEMLKSTKTSNHLSDSAKSLLQIAISVDTVKHLSKIRDFLSHADKGQLSTRDDKKYGELFHDIRQDLIIIKQMITPVLNIYKKKLNKSLLEKGLTLLDKRIKNLPSEVSQHIGEINHLDFFNSKKSKSLIRQLSVDTGITIQLLSEIIWIRFNRDDLLHKINLTKKVIDKEIKSLLPIYIQNIKKVLAAIEDNNEKVNIINQELKRCKIKETLPDNPNNKAITTIKSTIEIMKRDKKNTHVDYDAILLTLKDIKDFSGLWEIITQMSFCYNESGDELCEIDKEGTLEIKNNVPSVTKILEELDDKCKSDKNVAENHTFDAIEKLDDFFKKHIGSRIGPDKLKSLLIKRLKDLKEVLEYEQHLPLKENLHKYKNDQKFRFQLEIVLADIANLFAEFTTDKVMNKSNMLLREIDLRNVLHHGNPFLDVIADVFDPYDLSMGLLSKAEMFAEHGDSMIQNLP